MSGSLTYHYHIRWSGHAPLDYERFTTIEEAENSAKELVRPRESYSVEKFDSDCIRCKPPSKESLRQVLAMTVRKSAAEYGALWILNTDSGTLRMAAQQGFSPRFLERFTLVHGDFAACGTTLKRRERVLVNDVTTDPIYKEKSLVELMQREGVRSIQSLPLFSGPGHLVGVVAVHYHACDMPSISAYQLGSSHAQDVADYVERFIQLKAPFVLEDGTLTLRFDIFSGQTDGNASRIESVEGLGNAYELMTKLAERSPGSYFILDPRTHTVRGSICTSTAAG
jgi:hypothetical protein